MGIQKGDIVRRRNYSVTLEKGNVYEVINTRNDKVIGKCVILRGQDTSINYPAECFDLIYRPEPKPFKPEIGKWYKFWDKLPEDFIIERLEVIDEGDDYSYKTSNGFYENCAPITEEDIKTITNE